MRVEVCRTLGGSGPPCPDAYVGEYHSTLNYVKYWLIDIASIEDFARQYGRIVVEPSPRKEVEFCIEIYDNYRE